MRPSNIFYHPHISETCILSEEESLHAVRVLRLKTGDEINLTDGKGGLFTGKITESDPKKCALKIISKLPVSSSRPPAHLHLVVAPTKSIDRYEWFLEKATEIGVSEITPVICEHSERKILNIERLEKILIAAMKQSLNLYLPRLNPLIKFQEFIISSGRNEEEKNKAILQKFIAHSDNPGQTAIDYLPSGHHLKNCYEKGRDVVILIGPEGDFSEEELWLAKEKGFAEVSLGKQRFRTETAAIIACHTVSLLNENQR